jgi:hypothetical protein
MAALTEFAKYDFVLNLFNLCTGMQIECQRRERRFRRCGAKKAVRGPESQSLSRQCRLFVDQAL